MTPIFSPLEPVLFQSIQHNQISVILGHEIYGTGLDTIEATLFKKRLKKIQLQN